MNKRLKAARMGSFVLILALFGTVLAFTDLEKAAQAFAGIKWRWAIWVPVLNVANTFVEGLRLAIILLPVTGRFEVRNCFNSALVAIMGNIMLPLRFGDGARTYYIAKTEKISLSSSFSALMLDRIADFLLFFALMAITAILHPFPPSVTRIGLTAGFIFALSVGMIFALTGIGSHIGQGSVGKLRRRIAREVGNFMSGLSVMRNGGLLFPIILCSAVSWLLRSSMLWSMFKAFSFDLPLTAAPIVLILLNFGIAIVSTPANLGGFELGVVAALNRLFSVKMVMALSYAVALHAIEVGPMIAFAMVFLWHEGFRTSDVLKSAKEEMEKQQTP